VSAGGNRSPSHRIRQPQGAEIHSIFQSELVDIITAPPFWNISIKKVRLQTAAEKGIPEPQGQESHIPGVLALQMVRKQRVTLRPAFLPMNHPAGHCRYRQHGAYQQHPKNGMT
jgi:hypothetical protein